MGLLWSAFLSFAKIGALTIGGGYAMVPIIEEEIVDKKGWVQKEDFLDLLALSQSLPGILAVNVAIYTGYRIKGVQGAISCALGVILPSFFIILLLAFLFQANKDNQILLRIFKGMRPAVVALIAVPTFRLGKSAGINLKTIWIPVLGALAIYLLGFSPVWVIALSGLGGLLWGWITRMRDKTDEEGKEDPS